MNAPRVAALALMAVIIMFALIVLALGVWPIVAECGRLPHGHGEALNRVFGWSRGCA
jgi:hypothetical protein